MCLLILAWRDRPGERLVLLGNRDEAHARPSAPAAWWRDAPAVLGGRDLVAGGSWLGVTREGRFAVVTNVRELGERAPKAPALPRSRGSLVEEFLSGTATPAESATRATNDGAHYAGFNLIVGDRDSAWYASNRAAARALAPGVYALSNATLDASWPKVERLRAGFAAARDGGDRALLALLADRAPAPDAELPATGLDLARERLVSSVFVVSPEYGTRAATLVRFADSGQARFIERRFNAAGNQNGESLHAFKLEAA